MENTILLDDYKNYLIIERNSSLLTVSSYLSDLHKLANFFINGFSNTKISDFDKVFEYLANFKITTYNRKISVLKNFYAYLLQTNIITQDFSHIFIQAKKDERLIQIISDIDMTKLLTVLENGNDLMSHCLVLSLIDTGIRVSELINIKLNDIHLSQQLLKITGKGNKQRLVILSNRLTLILTKFLASKKESTTKSSFLFTNKNKPLNRQYVNKLLIKLSNLANTSSLHPHLFRHTLASNLVAKNMDLNSIKQLLGHASIDTTQLYTHVSDSYLQQTIKQFHPRIKKENNNLCPTNEYL
jgi:integrase/recombinase XerC